MAFPRPVFELRIRGSRIDYSRDYGIDRRKGWSVETDGCVEKQFIGFVRAFAFWVSRVLRRRATWD